MTSNKMVKVEIPFVQPQMGRETDSFQHVYRQDGFRMQEEIFENKKIYHNYGQGGAQLSLAYGCAYMVHKVFSLKNDASKIKQVAVLGSGINAIFTALELIKRGFRVTLYSKQLITPQSKYIPKTQKGYQFWYPGNYDNSDPLKHELITKLSLQFYKQCLFASRYRSLSWIDCYSSGPKADQIRQFITQFIIQDIPQMQVDFGAQQLQQFYYFKTILVNTELLMSQIMTQLQLRNIKLQNKEFNTLDDVLSIRQDYIFNCLEGENRYIFADPKVRMIRTHFIKYSIPSPNQPDVVIWQSSEEEAHHDLTLIIRKKQFIIGGTWETQKQQSIVDQGAFDKLFRKKYKAHQIMTFYPIKL